jgi:hypothetical protein
LTNILFFDYFVFVFIFYEIFLTSNIKHPLGYLPNFLLIFPFENKGVVTVLTNSIFCTFVKNGGVKFDRLYYGALQDLFSFAVLSGNAAWLCTFVARERGEEGEWDEWEGENIRLVVAEDGRKFYRDMVRYLSTEKIFLQTPASRFIWVNVEEPLKSDLHLW